MTSKTTDRRSPLRLIQITDSHLGAEPGEALLGLDTDASLLDVLQRLGQSESAAELVVASGDITSDAHPQAYQRFLCYMARHFDVPLAWLAGNHDSDVAMRVFPAERVQREQVELEHWQLVLLDSSVPGHEHGDLSRAEMDRLEKCLKTSDKHTLVFVHHQPLPVGCEWIDQYVIRNGPALLDLLSRYPQVKGLVWGHVHQDFNASHRHFVLKATPSTCIQFKPYSADFTLDDAMPGYRWFDLHANGRLETGIERVEAKDYGIDFASSGY